MRNKRNAAIAGIVSLVVMTICLWLIVRNIGDPAMPLNTLAPAGKQNWEIFNLVKPVFFIAGLVFLAVEAGVIWMAVRTIGESSRRLTCRFTTFRVLSDRGPNIISVMICLMVNSSRVLM